MESLALVFNSKLSVGLIGLLGAFIGYHLRPKLDQSKKTIEIRSEVYLEFLDALASDNQVELRKAKTKLVLVASDDVIDGICDLYSQPDLARSQCS